MPRESQEKPSCSQPRTNFEWHPVSPPVIPVSRLTRAAFGTNFLQFNTDHDSQHHTRESQTINPERTNANGFLTSTSPLTHRLPFNSARSPPAKLKGDLTFQSISYKLFQVSAAEKQTKSFCIFLAQAGNERRKSCMVFYRAAYERIRSCPDFCDLPEESVIMLDVTSCFSTESTPC